MTVGHIQLSAYFLKVYWNAATLIYCLWLHLYYNSKVEWLQQRPYSLQSMKYLLSGFFWLNTSFKLLIQSFGFIKMFHYLECFESDYVGLGLFFGLLVPQNLQLHDSWVPSKNQQFQCPPLKVNTVVSIKEGISYERNLIFAPQTFLSKLLTNSRKETRTRTSPLAHHFPMMLQLNEASGSGKRRLKQSEKMNLVLNMLRLR